MADFLQISTEYKPRKNTIDVSPDFLIRNNRDLMIRGSNFYAVWDEEKKLWSREESDAAEIIDHEIYKKVKEIEASENNRSDEMNTKTTKVVGHYIRNANSGSARLWRNYLKNLTWDNYHELDEKLIFSNMETTREDFASIKLNYPLQDGKYELYDELMSVLYDPDEREKIEWDIGAIVSGDSRKIQKFIVLYGAAGTGKSTVLNIIQQLFDGYYATFEAKTLASSNNQFAMEDFKNNPLVAIQHDGDLSKIEDNTKLNSIVSHEPMVINEKYKTAYMMTVNSFLFMGTNKPVKITEAKSGLTRRLIDVKPSGRKVAYERYMQIMSGIPFELSGIAWHCLQVYKELGEDYYEHYTPIDMMGSTNDFFDFMENYYDEFAGMEYIQLKDVWDMYRKYCDYAQVRFSYPMRLVRIELQNYFEDYKTDWHDSEGKHLRNVYIGFRKEKFRNPTKRDKPVETDWLFLDNAEYSLFDATFCDMPAQLANSEDKPRQKWENVKTTLCDIPTDKVHYVKLPNDHIVIDFDLKDDDGNKSLDLNLKAANKWPKTYAEISKGGQGIHLHYTYDGDVDSLSRVYDKDIEVKVFNGNSSLRRRLTLCNDIPIATISSGLPLKGAKKMVNFDGIKNEKGLRTIIQDCLEKKHHGATKPEVDFIYKILDDAYKSGMEYDVTDLRPKILSFATKSSNQSAYCVKLVSKMKFCSDKVNSAEDTVDSEEAMVFFDIEVFPNLFVICWKIAGEEEVHKMINPSPVQVEQLTKYRLVGFNNRKYDNHILYARILGYDNYQLYKLSQTIIGEGKNSRNAMFSGAYNLSYTDVLDFASAGNKQSLKKWEIDLGIHHQELGIPWDQEVPEDMWDLVADYCINDVVATEVVFNHLKADWTARQILADLAGMSVNSSTNSLTTRIIFGNDKNPQSQFNYRDMSLPVKEIDGEMFDFLKEACPYMVSDSPEESDSSVLPYFPGYTFDNGVSTYRGVEVGEGGYVYSEPGVYGNVALLDISSMHPHSAIAEVLFGVEYTSRFRDIVEGRVSIKHEDWDTVAGMLDGKLVPYIEKVKSGEMTSKDLANALKTAINSVYGLTKARFENPFRDPRNKDNIVAKRGALFMVDLLNEVQKRDFRVAHIKTDSIKIPDATPEIIEFVMEFGRKYGYEFEHEATYDKLCLINKADYVAKYKDGPWTSTGKQFSEPYVFKTLFSHEKILFEDCCQTKSVKKGDIYIDMNENLPEGEHDYQFVGRVGSFVPIKPGHGGGELYCLRDGKYDAVAGTKGYRWLEAEVVKELGREEDVDETYFIAMVDNMAKEIESFCHDTDFEWFLSEDLYDGRFEIPF